MKQYLVVYENGGPNWSAFMPDLHGCVSTGGTLEECIVNIQDAMETYIEAIKELGEPVRQSKTKGEYVRIA